MNERLVVACALAGITSGVAGQVANVEVPGTGNPWLAGMPAGSMASGDTAPAESPLRVPFAVVGGATVRFTNAAGMAGVGGAANCPPEGCPDQFCHVGAENGIANTCFATEACLIGVFLDDSQPDTTAAPADLDFRDPLSLDFAVLTPQLKQVFFIGDGLRADGVTVQQFVAPAGATRLFLGISDGSGWYNNAGAFTVTVMQTGGGGSTCYANCDQSTSSPFLNVNDFICFQSRFAAGSSYANCDGSTISPVLNVNDFICFQTRFAAGCSAP